MGMSSGNVKFLGAKKRYKRLRRLVGRSVGRLVRPYVPTMQLRGKLVTSRLLQEEEKEEETDYVAIPSFWAANPRAALHA
jgi:hypothetical protein